MTSLPLPPGLYPQLFLDAFSGDRRERLREFTRGPVPRLSIVAGVVCHDFPRARSLGGFSRDPVKRAAEMVGTIRDGFLRLDKRAGLAYGLDGATDGDSTVMTAVEKGDRMGRAAAASRADLVLPNAETQWDSDKGVDDDMDESGALAMGRAYRAHAPTTITIDQPWPMPDQHGENRKRVLPLGQGGSFAGFPIDEFASWVDGRAPQVYWANWYRTWGSNAYSKVVEWSEREWATIEAGMRRLDEKLIRPRTATLQGYGHDAYPWTLADYLLRHITTKPIILWSDPAPTAGTIRILRVVDKLVVAARDASRTPIEHLTHVQRTSGLSADGIFGPKTWAALDV